MSYDDRDFALKVALVIGIPVLLLAMAFGFSAGREGGIKQACASVRAEWRNDKCVRVIEEEVK